MSKNKNRDIKRIKASSSQEPGTDLAEIIGAARDITERRQAEDAFRESESKYRTLFESSTDAIMTLDENSFIDCNTATLKMFACNQKSDFVLLHPGDISPPNQPDGTGSRAAADLRIAEAFEKGSSQFEWIHRRRNGQDFPAEVLLSAFKLGGKQVLQATVRDITERRRMEEALRKQAYDLNERVKEINCLYAISDIAGKQNVTLNQMFQGIVDVIPSGWQCPEITCARIGLENQEFKTNSFRVTNWKQTADITVHGNRVGAVEVCYLEERPEMDEGPFLNNERDLLNVIAGRLGKITERKQAEDKLGQNAQHLKDLLGLYKMEDSTEKSIIEYMQDVCSRSLQSQFAFIGLISADEAVETIHTWSKGVMEQCAIMEKPMHFPVAEAGLWGEVVRQRRPIMVNDYDASDEYKKGYPKGHVPIKRFLSIPVFSAGKIVAVAAVANKISEYDESDVNALTPLLHEMWNLIERQHVQEALKESEGKYRGLINASIDAVIAIDPEMKVTVWNQGAARIFSYKEKEMLGQSLMKIVPERFRGKMGKGFALYKKTGSGPIIGKVTEIYGLRKDGTEIPIELSLSSRKFGNTHVTISIIRDITERKQAEQALHESESRYRLLAENVTDVIWTMDMNLRFTYVSPSIMHQTGYSVEEAMVMTPGEMFTAASLEMIQKAFAEELALEQMEQKDLSRSRTLELERYCKDGSTIWLEINMVFLRDSSEQAIGIQGVSRDITKRKQVEGKNLRLISIIESSDDAIIGKNLEGIITSWNKGAENIYGYKNTEVIGKSIALLVPQAHHDEVQQLLEKIKCGEHIQHYETVRLRKDGNEVQVSVTISPIMDRENRIIGASTIASDITRLKLAEQKTRASEVRFRRLFETAQDGILIIDAETGQITDVNPFLAKMLGYSQEDILGKRLWEIGFFKDIEASKAAFSELQEKGYIRYENLPLETKDGQKIEVEFVSNVYLVDSKRVIQCNIRDNTEREQLKRKLLELATHDPLTGLPNRTLLYDRFKIALANAQRNNKMVGIMSLDLDRFKIVNDSLGHNVGDKLLVSVADRLTSILRKYDTVCRMGGDEFVVLLWEVDPKDGAIKGAQRILGCFRQPFIIDEHTINITVSAGIAICPKDGNSLEDLMQKSDKSLYHAKESGRDNFKLYTG